MSLPIRSPRHTIVPASQARERGGVFAVWSEQKRVGDWSLPRHVRVACVMGSAVVDLREARIPEGGSTIEVFSLMGSVEILAPPGLRVEVDGDSLAGEFSMDPQGYESPPLDGPTIRVIGSSYFASVTAAVRYPGESEKEAKRRAKQGGR